VITKLHDSLSLGHKGVASIFAKALDRLWWKRIRQDAKGFLERCVVCRRAKIQSQMAATVHALHVPPMPWHTIGLDYLTHLRVRNGFDSVVIVVGHLTQMAQFLPCIESVTTEENARLFL
jgi:hypothetical protein